MALSNAMSRLTEYYRRHGFKATTQRASVAARKALFANRMVVFYCDLAKLNAPPVNIPGALRVERVTRNSDLNAEDLEQITSFWNPKQAHRNIQERFEKGASLWLVKSVEKVAGYGWTLFGSSIEPYYFPLASEDVHFFDFHVFPQYRGQGINPSLVAYILRTVARDSRGRAFIEAAEWNHAQLSSLQKTAFVRLGRVASISVFGRRYTSWTERAPVRQEAPKETGSIPTVASSHE